MLGPPKPRRLDQPIAVSLEDLVPRDHFYRHLEAKLDLSFVREWVRELYADRGRPSLRHRHLFGTPLRARYKRKKRFLGPGEHAIPPPDEPERSLAPPPGDG